MKNKNIKPITILINNQEKINTLKELGNIIKKKPLEKSNYQFLNPPLPKSDYKD